MKTLMLMLLLIGTPAMAFTIDETPSINWLLLRMALSGENNEDRIQHVVSHGASKEDAKALIGYVDAVTEDYNASIREEMARECAARAQYEADKELFAKVVELNAMAAQDFYKSQLAQIPANLQGLADMLIRHMAVNATISQEPLSAPDAIRSPGYDLKHVFDRVCPKPTEEKSK